MATRLGKPAKEYTAKDYNFGTDASTYGIVPSVTTQDSSTWNIKQPGVYTTGSPYRSEPRPDPFELSSPSNYLGPVEGVDELCQMLGVSPTEQTNGLFLVGKESQRYSLVEVIAAQLEMMQKLHVLLVHRDLTPESGE